MTDGANPGRRAGAALGWLAFALALALGVPVSLRLPAWCDLSLYEVAASEIARGGAMYRDVFDTNLPGFVLLLTGVRALLGSSTEAVYAADLVIVAGAAAVLGRLAGGGRTSRAAGAWYWAGCAWFYLFTSEFVRAQRDVWMLLPALLAVWLPWRHLVAGPTRGEGRALVVGLVAGLAAGLALSIKPHAGLPLSLGLAAALPAINRKQGARPMLAYSAAGLSGVALVLGAVALYLVRSGAWESFCEVFGFWNPGYVANMWGDFTRRVRVEFQYFPPWSYLHFAAAPLATAAMLDAATGGRLGARLPGLAWKRAESGEERVTRLVLGAVYAGWGLQALVVQRTFHYAHAPEVFLALGVLRSQGWLAAAPVLAWLGAASLLIQWGAVPDRTPPAGFTEVDLGLPVWVRHPLAEPERLAAWPSCFARGLSPRAAAERSMHLAQIRDFSSAVDWPELHDIAAELRRREARDGEVAAWHDTPHGVYLLLPLRPGLRFQHVSAMMNLGPVYAERVFDEFEANSAGVRYVVTDLKRVAYDRAALPDYRTTGADGLPTSLRPDLKTYFPLDQPVIFRSGGGAGRYALHELRRPFALVRNPPSSPE